MEFNSALTIGAWTWGLFLGGFAILPFIAGSLYFVARSRVRMGNESQSTVEFIFFIEDLVTFVRDETTIVFIYILVFAMSCGAVGLLIDNVF